VPNFHRHNDVAAPRETLHDHGEGANGRMHKILQSLYDRARGIDDEAPNPNGKLHLPGPLPGSGAILREKATLNQQVDRVVLLPLEGQGLGQGLVQRHKDEPIVLRDGLEVLQKTGQAVKGLH